MKKRNRTPNPFRFIVCSVFICIGALMLTSLPQHANSASPNAKNGRPNIVFILLDDQDQMVTDLREAMPFATENILKKGLVFQNAFAPTPICCAARASILTGRYGHNNGVLTNYGLFGGLKAFNNPLTFDNNPLTYPDGTPVVNEDTTMAVYLQQAGYRTALFGKYLNGWGDNADINDPKSAPPVPRGWSEFFGGPGASLYYGYNYLLEHSYDGTTKKLVAYGDKDSDYSTDVLGNLSADFIRRNHKNHSSQPFFMYVAPTAPHAPLQPPTRYLAASKKWVGKLPKRHNYNEDDISDKSHWLRLSGEKRSRILKHPNYFTLERNIPGSDTRKFLWTQNPDLEYPNRMGSLMAVDDMIKNIFQALADSGELENTIFVLTSDNGYNLGAHRLVEKMAPYEESIRVPLAISGPGVRAGSTTAFAMEPDYLPTFLDLAYMPIPKHVDGKSLVPVMHTPESELQPSAFRSQLLLQYAGEELGSVCGAISDLASQAQNKFDIKCHSEGILGRIAKAITAELPPSIVSAIRSAALPGVALDIPSYRALRTMDYTYIEWWMGDEHEYELYSLKDDELQERNLLAKPSYANSHQALLKELNQQLQALSECSGESCQ